MDDPICAPCCNYAFSSERSNESAGCKIVDYECQAAERYALPIDSGFYRHY